MFAPLRSPTSLAHRRSLLFVFLWAMFVFSILFLSSPSHNNNDNNKHTNPINHQHAGNLQNHLKYHPKHTQRRVAASTSQNDEPSQDNNNYQSNSTQPAFPNYKHPSSLSPSNNQTKFAHSLCNYHYPNLFDLQFSNVYWQQFKSHASQWHYKSLLTRAKQQTNYHHPTPNDTFNQLNELSQLPTSANFYLYNAYYDNRWRANGSSVRILAMIDKVKPPEAVCIFWQHSHQSSTPPTHLESTAKYTYAWYPKWGNYRDGILQPFIINCPLPQGFEHVVPISITLADVPPPKAPLKAYASISKFKRLALDSSSSSPNSAAANQQPILVPASFSSSASPFPTASSSQQPSTSSSSSSTNTNLNNLDCAITLPLTNNLPVQNERPAQRQKFAVCVKGLDFPDDDISIRLVEWLELLEVLGASKVFLYNLNVDENTSRVLKYYKRRGLVELSELTLPGNQPNLPEYQHLYLKTKTTNKRQNELIPYNDCLYRNLYSFEYLALLDIDEIIMPLEHTNWHQLMASAERLALKQQNYSRASYNFRNVYFFDDLAAKAKAASLAINNNNDDTTSSSQQHPSTPDNKYADEPSLSLPSDSSVGYEVEDEGQGQAEAEREGEGDKETESENESENQYGVEPKIPEYLHMMRHVFRSRNYTKPDQYVKCFHNVDRVVSLHNHFPLNCFGQCTTFAVPTSLAHLQHYRKDCVGPLKQSCKTDFRSQTTRDTTIWKYRTTIIRRATRVLRHLKLINLSSNKLKTNKLSYRISKNNEENSKIYT